MGYSDALREIKQNRANALHQRQANAKKIRQRQLYQFKLEHGAPLALPEGSLVTKAVIAKLDDETTHAEIAIDFADGNSMTRKYVLNDEKFSTVPVMENFQQSCAIQLNTPGVAITIFVEA